MYNGVINIRKDAGMTSHDVVWRLRRITGQKKIGHTGTLDPQAEGVLPVCLGSGTRLCDLFTDRRKEYRTLMRLGVTTDTQDLTGNVTAVHEVSLSAEDVVRAVRSFVGTYEQMPPMYSAVKVGGRKLYELARKGIEVERRPRPVTIDSIVIEEIDLPLVTMTVSCSKGTYIRTLCEDIGNRLGCGACMQRLLRTRVGSFLLEDSISLEQAAGFQQNGTLEKYIIPPDSIFPEAGKAVVSPEADKWLSNGNPLTEEDFQVTVQALSPEKRIRMYSSDGIFMGLYAFDTRREDYRPEKMFIPL